MLLLGILGLSYAMYVVTKETETGSDNVMRSTTTNSAVMTGSADFAVGPNGELSPRTFDTETPSDLFSGAAHANRYARALSEEADSYDAPALSTRSAYQHRRLTSNLPDSFFEELRFLKVMSPSGNSLALRVEGILRAIEPGSACGSVLKILTAAGTIQVDGYDMTFTDESISDAFQLAGFQVESVNNRRRLNGLVSLLGLFNAIAPYEFNCPLVEKPNMPAVWTAATTKFTPCNSKKLEGTGAASPCEPPSADSPGVALPPIVDYNGGRYMRTRGHIGTFDGVSVGVSYDSEQSGSMEEGETMYVIYNYYQSVDTGLPVRVEDDFGSIIDYTSSTSDEAAARMFVEAYANAECDPMTGKLLRSAEEHETDLLPENMEEVDEEEARRLEPRRRLTAEEDGVSSYYNETSGVTITNLGGMKALRWVFEGSNGLQCMSSTSSPGAINTGVCDLYDPLQKFTWQGTRVTHTSSGSCVGADADGNVKLVSCTSSAVLNLVPNVADRRIVVLGTSTCLRRALVPQTLPDGVDTGDDVLPHIPSIQVGACDTAFAIRILTDLELQDNADPDAPILVTDADLSDEESVSRRLAMGKLMQPKRRAMYRNPEYPHDLNNLPPITVNAHIRARRMDAEITGPELERITEQARNDPSIKEKIARGAAAKVAEEASRALNSQKKKDDGGWVWPSCDIEFDVPMGCEDDKCKVSICIDFILNFKAE
ncbi:unnamed protein product, partial [Symbiodinium sp. KB8]